MNRVLLAEGATTGPGLFLQGIPSVSRFRFSPQVMRAQVKALVGVSPAPTRPWAHSCGGGKVLELQGDECSHLNHCSQQGRANAAHDAVLEQLRGMLLDAEYGYGWRVERTLEILVRPSISAPDGPTCLVLILLACCVCPGERVCDMPHG